MGSASHFDWWTWIVGALTALATFLAVLAALFLDWFRARFFPPNLILSLVDRRGAPPIRTFIGNPVTFETVSRWYHVQVINQRRMTPARDTQVYLMAVEELDAANQYIRRPTGAIPFPVRHGVFAPPGRAIGPTVEWDLCSVARESSADGPPMFSLHTVVAPTDIVVHRTAAFSLILNLQARSIEADLNMLRLEVAWDGHWAEDTDQMSHHLVIRTL